jgi:hypothetical protein
MRWANAVLCLLLLSSGAARAVPLGDASVSSTVLFNLGGRLDSTQFGTLALTDPRFGSVSAAVGGAPSTALVSSAHIGPNAMASIYGRGVGGLTFYFAIDGPAATVPVLIDVAGRATGDATAGATFLVASSWTLYESSALSTTLAGDSLNSTQITGTFDESFGRTVSLNLTTNHVYAVLMQADAQAAATDVGSRSFADASVDPLFAFGPGVDTGLYSFSFSPGVGNTVPEPSALALAAAALVSLCGLRRRDALLE